MKFYQLGFRYLQRKKGKTILLLIVLILVNSMILGTSMILRTTNESKQAMQEKTNSKIVAEITSKDSKITENEVNKIETLEDVSSINRIGRQEVFPNDFAPVTLNTSTNEENLKIALLSYDDLEKDSPFSEMQYRLSSGDYIKHEKKGAVINANLANQNELKVGDTIELSTENGTKVSVQIIGIFMSAGNVEKDQPTETTAVNRIENQVFIDNSTYKELFKEAEFEKLCVYSKRPEKLDVLETSLQKIFGNDVELSTSDTLYQQMSAPLEQISKVANLMLVLTLVTGTVVVSLLLCMWMRTRQKEVAKGTVLCNGEDITKKGLNYHRKHNISLVFQNYNLIDYLTTVENVKLGGSGNAEKLLEEVGIGKEYWQRNVLQLSGGQQQRVAIARALASDAHVLLADEPTGNLDETTADEIIALLKKTAHELGKCVVVVTHSKHLAEEADEILEIKNGAISFLSD